MTDHDLHSRLERNRYVRFLLIGMLNTVFGYAVFALAFYVGASPALALLIATAIGILFNFFTTGQIVFNDRGTSRLPHFVFAYCATYLINLALLKIIMLAGVNGLIAQAISLPVVAVCSFFILRRFVFTRGRMLS